MHKKISDSDYQNFILIKRRLVSAAISACRAAFSQWRQVIQLTFSTQSRRAANIFNFYSLRFCDFAALR